MGPQALKLQLDESFVKAFAGPGRKNFFYELTREPERDESL